MLRRVCKLLGFNQNSFANNTGDRKLILDQGNTVPADGTAGYATGALYMKRDGGAGTSLYVNEGTASSCDFNALAGA